MRSESRLQAISFLHYLRQLPRTCSELQISQNGALNLLWTSIFDLAGATEDHSDGDIALAPCHKSLFLADFKLQVPECMPTTILSRYEASIAAIILRCSARAVPPTNSVGARWPLGAGATSVPLGYQLCAVTSMPTKLTINSGKGFIDLHSCAATTLSLLTEKSLRFPAAKSVLVAASMVVSFNSTSMSGVNRMSDAI